MDFQEINIFKTITKLKISKITKNNIKINKKLLFKKKF